MTDNKQWNCPLCSRKRMAYGATCKNYPRCGNDLNANGRWYRDNGYLDGRRDDVVSIGIAEIANEDK